ncbi:glutamate--tRNA ligase family protein [Candidatus Vidania fulgoroideorum]
MNITTRFAPSPTGKIHIGNLRGILFSYIFSKKNIGKFYLRIDNTDFLRSKKNFFTDIIKTFNWIRIKYDNKKNILFQNKRKNIYFKKAIILVKKKKAYFYKGAIKFKINKDIKVSWIENKKKIYFNNSTINDFVIIRSNGMSTYNFSTVIDDYYLKITHVLRGIEHIDNTAKQINISKALKIKSIKYIHFSNFIDKKKKKISKRNHNYSIKKYKIFFPCAIVSYILNSCGKNYNTFCRLKFFIKNFSLQNIKKCPTILNKNIILWYNKEYIKKNFISIYLKLKNNLKKYFYFFFNRIDSLYDLLKIKRMFEEFKVLNFEKYYYYLIRAILNYEYKDFRNIFIKNSYPIFINIFFIKKMVKRKSFSSNGKDNTPSRCK